MSSAAIPNSFLFRYSIRCPRVDRLPLSGEHIVRLGPENAIPCFSRIDGVTCFGQLWIGWNENGLGVAFEVPAKSLPVHAEPQRATGSDGLSLWLDTRDTRTIHRASRYCQRFLVLPHDGGEDAACQVVRKPIKRAAEEPPAIDHSQIRIARFALGGAKQKSTSREGDIKSYRIECFFPASVLVGFDPESNRRLGLFYRIRDHEFGDQILSGSRELPYWEDPSLWATLVLEP